MLRISRPNSIIGISKSWMMAVIQQTSIFLNVEPEVAKNITAFQANSSERGVTYNVTTSGNITKLVITSDFASLLK